MNGIDNIIASINRECDESISALDSEFNAQKEEFSTLLDLTLGRIKEDARERLEKLLKDIPERTLSSEKLLRRNIILEYKNRLIDEAFELAEKQLPLSKDYPEILGGLLKKSVEQCSRDVVISDVLKLRLRKEDAPLFDVIVSAAGDLHGRKIIPGEAIDEAGFILVNGDVESNCTAGRLILDVKQKLTGRVAAELFG